MFLLLNNLFFVINVLFFPLRIGTNKNAVYYKQLQTNDVVFWYFALRLQHFLIYLHDFLNFLYKGPKVYQNQY